AEDGIRDRNVTGVQTCALPICLLVQRHDHDHPQVVAVHLGGQILQPVEVGVAVAGTNVFQVEADAGHSAAAETTDQFHREVLTEIGRASCRERGYITGCDGL